MLKRRFYLVEYIIYCIFVVLKLKQSRTNLKKSSYENKEF